MPFSAARTAVPAGAAMLMPSLRWPLGFSPNRLTTWPFTGQRKPSPERLGGLASEASRCAAADTGAGLHAGIGEGAAGADIGAAGAAAGRASGSSDATATSPTLALEPPPLSVGDRGTGGATIGGALVPAWAT